MGAIAQLEAFLGLETGQYKAGVKEVTSLTSSFQKSISGIGGMLAGAFSVGAIIQFGRSLMETAHNMANVGDAVGLTMEQLVALKTIGAENGLEFEKMSTVLGKVRDAQGQVVNLSKPMEAALARLGINADDFVGAGTDEALAMIAKGFVDAGGSAEAFNAVNDIFGAKIGRKTIEMLKALDAEGLAPLIDRTKDAAAGFNELAAAQATIEKFFNSVQLGAAKVINKFSNLGAIARATWKTLTGEMSEKDYDKIMSDIKAGRKPGETPGATRSWDEKTGATAGPPPTGKSNPDLDKRHQNQAEEARKKAEEANKKAQELGRHYYFKELKNQDEIDSLYEDYAKEGKGLSKIKGQGENVDSMMRMGGLVGGARPGLAAADRQLRVAQESKELLREFNIKLQRLIDKQDTERDRNEG